MHSEKKIHYINGKGTSRMTTPDDLFSRKERPGKTLYVGRNSVSLECSGFLHMAGNPYTDMVRYLVLEGLDREMVRRLIHDMRLQGIKFKLLICSGITG